MLKARLIDPSGKQIILLGLSFRNLDKFKAEPGDTFIPISGEELGVPFDIIVMSGETEDRMAQLVAGGRLGEKLGAIGDFPRGKLNEDDEGGLRFAIAVQDKTVIVDWGKPVSWIGFNAAEARRIAAALIAKADEADGQIGV